MLSIKKNLKKPQQIALKFVPLGTQQLITQTRISTHLVKERA